MLDGFADAVVTAGVDGGVAERQECIGCDVGGQVEEFFRCVGIEILNPATANT